MRNTSFSVAAAAALALSAQESTDDVFRASAQLVVARVSVIAKDGSFVHGLVPDDFRVYDNGRAQSARVDDAIEPISLVIAVQSNVAVRNYLPQIAKVGSVVKTLLVGERGEAALLRFADDVTVIQPLTNSGDLIMKGFRSITASGDRSRLVDAVERGASVLSQRSRNRRRILLLISQLSDVGSETRLEEAISKIESTGTRVFSIVIPRAGKAFVEDTVQIGGMRGGFIATLNLKTLLPEIYRASRSAAGEDAATILTAYSGGRRIPFRTLRQLESALTRLGEELYSEYTVYFIPDPDASGYHEIRMEVAKPAGALIYTRAGYYREGDPVRP